MSWFKKKEEQTIEEEIPELPELPNPDEFSLPDLPNTSFNLDAKNMPQLPQLPELKTEGIIHPEVIKQEVMKPRKEMQKSQFRPVETRQRQEPQFRPVETRQRQEPQLIRERQEIHEEPQEMPEITPTPIITKNSEPIYVRLDKFETSLHSIQEIKRKITEVENILKKTKEIKQKEEQELEIWEKEIHIIKSRVDAIDKTIFNKLD